MNLVIDESKICAQCRAYNNTGATVLSDEDVAAINRLRAYFMDYPVDQDQVEINEAIQKAPIKLLVDATLDHIERQKETIQSLRGFIP
jgi:hypothetical protein